MSAIRDYGLNERQRAFAEYYLQTRNATRSYMKAYGEDAGKEIKETTCGANGSKLLKDERIQDFLSDRYKEIDKERFLTEEEILLELNKMALDSAQKPSDRLKALELLGKNRALWSDKNDGLNDFQFNISVTKPEMIERTPKNIEIIDMIDCEA